MKRVLIIAMLMAGLFAGYSILGKSSRAADLSDNKANTSAAAGIDTKDDASMMHMRIGDKDEEQLKKERELSVSAYLNEHPDMASVVARIEKSYYTDLTGYVFTLANDMPSNDFFDSSRKLYERGKLDLAKAIPVYEFSFERDKKGNGNSFQRLARTMSKTSFAKIHPDITKYSISINEENGKSGGYITGTLAAKNSKEIIGYPWDGATIDTFTLKLSAGLLQALAQSSLDLSNVKAVLVSFAGHYVVVFYDHNKAFCTPIMGEYGVSDGQLAVGQLYPIAKAINAFEKAFDD